MDNTHFGFEEIHITKREDGKGFRFKGKGLFNSEPCTIEIPMLQTPKLSIDKKYDESYLTGLIYRKQCYNVGFELKADIKPYDEKYFTVTVDPTFHTKRKIAKLQSEIEDIQKEVGDRVACLSEEINKLKTSLE